MYCFEIYVLVRFEVFTKLSNEYIHTSAKKVVILTPDMEQNFFSLQDAVWMLTEELEQVCLFLGEIEKRFA